MNKSAIDRLNKPAVIPPSKDEPKLPHEKDESIEGMSSPKRKIVRRAASDLKRGLKDTDRGPEMEKTYKKQQQ